MIHMYDQSGQIQDYKQELMYFISSFWQTDVVFKETPYVSGRRTHNNGNCEGMENEVPAQACDDGRIEKSRVLRGYKQFFWCRHEIPSTAGMKFPFIYKSNLEIFSSHCTKYDTI